MLSIFTRRRASCGTLGNGHSNWEGNFPFTHWGTTTTTTTTLPKDHEEVVEDPQVNFLSVHAPLPSSPLTTTTVVIQDLDDEDDSRQVSKTKGKDESTSTTASQGAVLSDLPTTCYHLKGTSAKFAQDDSLKSSLSLSPSSEDKGKTTSTHDSVSREQALPFTTPANYIPTTSFEGCSLHDCNKGAVPLSLDNSQAFTSTILTHDLDHNDPHNHNHDIDVLINHSLPKSRTRTNVVTAEYTPRGRLFGGYTTRGTGVTHATFRFPDVLKAIMSLSSTRPKDFTNAPFLSAQLNAATSLLVHKDKNNLSRSWLIAFGDFTGGRLWVESPLASL